MAGAKPGVHVLQLKAVSVPKCLQEGEKFVKWEEDNSVGTPCTLRVDPNGFFLYWTYWTDQHETDMLDVSTISDTRCGRTAKLPKDPKLKEQVNIGAHDVPLEQKTMTVVHGNTFVDLSFTNFVHQKPDIVKFWADELLKIAYNLLSLNAPPMDLLKKTYTRLCIMKDKNGKIPVKQITRVFARHGDDRKRVENALDCCKLPNTKSEAIIAEDFTWEKFLIFYSKLTTRIEVEKVFCELTRQQHVIDRRFKAMTSDQFVQFLNEHQRDPRLNEILYPYADSSRAAELIEQYEPCQENIGRRVLSVEGFLNYLMSDDNTVISLDKLDLHHDMSQPFSHYFINSSHNTYLIGHQLTGKSSVEMYRQCLLAGCRCVELDFWNGKIDEPIIVHGYTLVPEISAKDVIEAIAECAFKTSDWPVILSFENHCNPRQQAKIAQYCREFFGDMLLDAPLESHPLEPGVALPSATDLRRKIIIKNKKKHRAHHKKVSHSMPQPPSGLGESQFHVDLTQSIADVVRPEVQGNGEIPRPPLEKEGSRESYPEEADVANGDIPVAEIREAAAEEDDSSYSEEEDEASLSPEDRKSQRRTTDTATAEVEAGAEISALVNYVQPVHFISFDVAEKRNKSYEMSSFVETQSLNLLKEHPTEFVNYNKRQLSRVYPRGTRVDSSNFLPHQFWNAGCQLVALNYQSLDLPMQLNLGIFEYNNRSGYLLKPDFMRRPDKRFDPFAESTVDGIIAGTLSIKIISGQFLTEKRVGCYVEVEMYGLPTDTFRKRFRTKTISNNGINPIWDEDPFVFQKVVLPEIATIRIAAFEDSNRSILGHRVLPLVGLIPGYKHIVLRNEKGQSLGLPTIFVHIKVGDYVPNNLSDFAEALANPIKYMNKFEKRSYQLEVFKDDDNPGDEDAQVIGSSNAHDAQLGPNAEPNTGQVQRAESNPYQKPETPPANLFAGRQNSVHIKTSITAKQNDDWAFIEAQSPPLALETVEIKAEELDKLWEHKSIRERKKKIEKELREIEGKLEKKRQGLLQELEKKKKEIEKSHSKLVKKFSTSHQKTASRLFRSNSVGVVLKTARGRSLSDFSFESDACKKNLPDATSQHKDLQTRLDDMEKVYRESLLRLHQEQLATEKRIQEESHEPLFNLLDKVMKMSQQAQLKALQSMHDSAVDETKKRQTEYHRERLKLLSKSTSDKQELERKKREVCNEIVAKGTQERQKLIGIYDKRKVELEKQHETIRQKFDEEKRKAYQQIQTTFDEKIAELQNDVIL